MRLDQPWRKTRVDQLTRFSAIVLCYIKRLEVVIPTDVVDVIDVRVLESPIINLSLLCPIQYWSQNNKRRTHYCKFLKSSF